jgi:hypothetical protein
MMVFKTGGGVGGRVNTITEEGVKVTVLCIYVVCLLL